VIKPASYAPETSHALARLISRYLDPDCFVVCEGNRDVTDALLRERFDFIFYTGSGYVGKLVAKAAAETLTPVILELGGKSPFIVSKCADLDLAAQRLMWGTFLNSGQTCIRPDHCLVHESVADKFLSLCKEKLVEMFSSDVQNSENFGRVINVAAFDRLKAIIDASRDKIYVGGKTDREDKFVDPTILDYGTDVDAFNNCAAMQDEIFGPILPVFRFKDFERDVIQRIRDLPTGKPLALYLFAEDSKLVDTVTRRTTSGGLCINDALMHIANADLPFGGVGASGMGAYHGFRSMKAFSHEKAVLTKYSFLDQNPALKWALAARYPPFTDTRKFLATVVTNPQLAALKEQLEHPTVLRVLLLALVVLVGRRMGFRLTRG
jgi:aldehyde dehydrogenase (NAD+)